MTIPHGRGLAGHSDADVLLHALADALLGAIGAPDLGELFPPGDPRYRNADSRRFVRAAADRIHRGGWIVGNVDATVITDAPTLTPYKARIRRMISGLLKVAPTQVSIKAKTTEGFSPAGDGMAAQAVVLLKKAQGSRLKAQDKSAKPASSLEPRASSQR